MKKLLFLLVAFSTIVLSCRKEKKGLASITTTAASGVTADAAVSGGTINDDGGSPIMQRGICWDTVPGPNVADSITMNGTGSGSFTSNLSALFANTTYYIRAYAVNGSGTAYGNELSFKTNAGLPTVTTTAISDVQPLSAKSGGTVLNDGGATITERGVVYSTSPNPTTSNYKISDGGTTAGSYTTTLSPLASQQTYYVRAYATNSYGTAYGNQVQFNAASANTVTDIDGNVYPYVTIGSQTWMTTNLKTTRFQNGDSIQNGVTNFNWYANHSTLPGYTFPDGNASNNNTYGKYYNRAVIIDTRQVCPTGWHVPTDDEWKTLEMYLGMSQTDADGIGYRGAVAPHLIVNGSSGLNLQFSGYFAFLTSTSADYLDLGSKGFYWTSTLLSLYNYYRSVEQNVNGVYRQYQRRYAMSIRCIKD